MFWRTPTRARQRAALACVVFACNAFAGCSLLIEFDETVRPCGENGECSDGYSCVYTQCVLNRSLAQGKTCQSDSVCEGNLRCAAFRCSTPCTTPMGATPQNGECGAEGKGLLCTLERTPGDNSIPIAACVQNDCQIDPDAAPLCPEGTACIAIANVDADESNVEGSCLEPCTIQCGPTDCPDPCAGDGEPDQHCQPVGPDHELSCIPAGIETQGERCDAEKFCAPGFACVSECDGDPGVCLAFCENDDHCAGVETCFAWAQDLSVCAASASLVPDIDACPATLP